MTGQIVLAATPIGNVGDASPRLREALATAEVVAAEDTRRLKDLARRLGVEITGAVVAFHDHNEASRAEALVERAVTGATVLVVTDAGMPSVSDPGYRLVEAAVAAGVAVTALPGPSAVLTALAVSGLPTDRFCFEGFPPRVSKAAALEALRGERRTMVFFESPRRVAGTLKAMAEAFGPDRRVAVAREMTKTHEEVRRGCLSELAAWAGSEEVLGEVTIVVEGAPAGTPSLASLADEAEARVGNGERLKDVVADIAGAVGVRSKDLYGEVLARRAASPTEPSR
ncbi:MAG: 16S rRNA (cytidine(1402)-2'-O)-methyltransferase [Demequinaceae bacterium]|nr:16S rRNA (cytidine(1402)-2'-O)-methyltransferase [Demequinaceae bacterium]